MPNNYLQQSEQVQAGEMATAAWANAIISDLAHLIGQLNFITKPTATVDSSKIESLEASKLTGDGFPFMISVGTYPIASDGGPNTPFGLGGPNNYWTYLPTLQMSRFQINSGVIIPKTMAGKRLILPFGVLIDGSTVMLGGSVHFINYVPPTSTSDGTYGAVATAYGTNMTAVHFGYSFLGYVILAV
jgi:hypothetical protein